ncbi:MAG: hypothetical protein U1F00_03990 [Rhodoferax sp.]
MGTPITPARALGLALIVGGDALVGGAGLLQALQGGTVWQGDLIFVLAASWATYSVLARKLALDALRGTVAITAPRVLLLHAGVSAAGRHRPAVGRAAAGFLGRGAVPDGVPGLVGSVAIAGVTPFTRM